MATAGDVNGDGYSDVVVGADGYSSLRGKVYLYLGGASGLSVSTAWTALGAATSNHFGACVSTAGDTNGDGYSDLLVGAWGYSSNRGRVYFYLGGPSGVPVFYSSPQGGSPGDYFGYSVASAGDVNGDGYSDVIAGAYANFSNLGMLYMYFGSPTGIGYWNWTYMGARTAAKLGSSVAGAGDVNGDGYGDVVVGGPGYNTNTGEAYQFYGSGGTGVPVRPRQLRSDGTTPIAPLGLAYGYSCRLGMKLRSPFGRALVKLEWQAVPQGASFNPLLNPIQRSPTWWVSSQSGTTRNALVSLYALDSTGLWTWRVRTCYSMASTPFQGHGPWFTLSTNGLMETDLRSTSSSPPVCVLPDEPCWLYSVVKNGSDYTLNWQDPNQANQRTGWNVRRSNDAAPPKDTWPLVATNVVDMDAGTPNYQWTDHSGDDPGPGGVWYFQVTTYNANCPAEGPF